jgi:hypothetical protein
VDPCQVMQAFEGEVVGCFSHPQILCSELKLILGMTRFKI